MFRSQYYGLRRIILTIGAILTAPFIFLFIYGAGKNKVDYGRPRILIMPHLTRIGDLVCATPVFRAIKEKYPNAYLAVLVAGRVEALVKTNPRIDEIIVYRHNDLWWTIKKIRERRFDWNLSLSGTSMSSVIALLGLIPNIAKITRRSRPLSEFFTDWLATNKLRYPHHVYLPGYYLRLLNFIRINNPKEIKEIFTSKSGEVKANDYFAKVGVNEHDVVVGMSITAGNKIKEWGDDKFQELVAELKKRYQVQVVFIGSKNDEQRIKKISSPEDAIATNFKLDELPSVLKRLNLFISVDSGPLYIAHALKVPLVDIIGPVDPSEQPPSDERSIQVLPPPYIKPSSFVMKKPGGLEEHKKATASISVEDVVRAVDELINSKAT